MLQATRVIPAAEITIELLFYIGAMRPIKRAHLRCSPFAISWELVRRIIQRPPFSRGTNVDVPRTHRAARMWTCISTSLRAKRSNPFSPCKGRMDCFVAQPVIGRAFARPVGSRYDTRPLSLMMTAVIVSRRFTRNPPMQTPREILADLWTLAGGDHAALDAVT